jgi:hypothetical protein
MDAQEAMVAWYKTLTTKDKDRYINFHNWAWREKDKQRETRFATCKSMFKTITGQAVPIFIKWCWYIQCVTLSMAMPCPLLRPSPYSPTPHAPLQPEPRAPARRPEAAPGLHAQAAL